MRVRRMLSDESRRHLFVWVFAWRSEICRCMRAGQCKAGRLSVPVRAAYGAGAAKQDDGDGAGRILPEDSETAGRGATDCFEGSINN